MCLQHYGNLTLEGRLGCCDLEIRCGLCICHQFHQAAETSVCPMCGGSVKVLGRIMGSCPEVR